MVSMQGCKLNLAHANPARSVDDEDLVSQIINEEEKVAKGTHKTGQQKCCTEVLHGCHLIRDVFCPHVHPDW